MKLQATGSLPFGERVPFYKDQKDCGNSSIHIWQEFVQLRRVYRMEYLSILWIDQSSFSSLESLAGTYNIQV